MMDSEFEKLQEEFVKSMEEHPPQITTIPSMQFIPLPVLRIEPGDVLVLKMDVGDHTPQEVVDYVYEQLKRVLSQAGHKDTPVVVLDRGMELSKFHVVPTRLHEADEPAVVTP